MTAALAYDAFITPEDYLEREQSSTMKHEYLDGQIVAMTGAGRKHNVLTLGLGSKLLPKARKLSCQLFVSDMKLRLDHQGEVYFYYPDLVLTCAADDRHDLYCTTPCLLVEVLSPSTWRVDYFEKRQAYTLIQSLREYVIVHQEKQCVEVFRRTPSGWQHEALSQGEVYFACLDARVTVEEIYADIVWDF